MTDAHTPWDSRKRMVATAIAQKDPDILGLQDAQKVQRQYLVRQLRGFGISGSILREHEKFERIGGGSVNLPGTGRPLDWVRLEIKDSVGELFIFNAHFPAALSEPDKVKLCRFTADFINRTAGTKSMVVMTGDLNIHNIDSGGIQVLREQARLCDPWTDTGTSQVYTWNYWFRPQWSGHTGDWILYRRPPRPRRVERPAHNEKGEYPSDHPPVFAALVRKALQ